jgi:hypothetical protein
MTKEEIKTALSELETQMKSAFGGLQGNKTDSDAREFDLAIQLLEEAVMWMRRYVERKFA